MTPAILSKDNLKGQHVLITGANGGIGLVCARLFLEQGCKVTMHFGRRKDRISSLLEEFPESTYALNVNASSETAIESGVSKAVEKFGFINVIVINHAIYQTEDKPIWEMELRQWENTLKIDLTSYFLYARAWTRQLKRYAEAYRTEEEKKAVNASIILIGSTAGHFGEALHMDYAVSKGAIQTGLLLSLKNEIVNLVPYARANVVAPGWVATEMAEEAIAEGKHLKSLSTMPMKKVATPEDIAANVYFFANPQLSSHITGSVQIVSGGMEGRIQHPFQ